MYKLIYKLICQVACYMYILPMDASNAKHTKKIYCILGPLNLLTKIGKHLQRSIIFSKASG